MHRHLLACASLVVAPLAAQDMIAVSWTGAVYAIDSFTGTSTSIGNGLFGQNSLAQDGLGQLWSTERPVIGQYSLTRIDPVTGTATVVAPNFIDVRGLANAGGGNLYGIQDSNPDRLVLIDTTTGQVTPIGPTNFSGIQSLAEVDGLLYAWDVNAGLVTIDAATGNGTDVNPSVGIGTASVQWLARRADGRLVGGNNTLYEIDLSTGVATTIGGTFLDLRGAEPYQSATRNFGTGCAGVAGLVTSSATIGSGPNALLTLQSNNHAPNAIGLIVVGISSTSSNGLPLPISVDPIFGTQGCTLYVSLDVAVLAITTTTLPATLDLQVPVLPEWPGYSLLVQHAVLENVPGGVSLSDAVAVQFGF